MPDFQWGCRQTGSAGESTSRRKDYVQLGHCGTNDGLWKAIPVYFRRIANTYPL